ncbi:hypothetical protein [Clostridium sp. C2-6-12]|uniref:hypothetical protein n=1 Tax=Clostridium sp. C2-6-12 TaxID=2698832 RepID=UPI00137096C3|nr:hypothetical protein [Clostridium sp. C2-6-12]
MKKIVLSVLAAAIVLSNGAFAATTANKDNNQKVAPGDNIITIQTQDPKGW